MLLKEIESFVYTTQQGQARSRELAEPVNGHVQWKGDECRGLQGLWEQKNPRAFHVERRQHSPWVRRIERIEENWGRTRPVLCVFLSPVDSVGTVYIHQRCSSNLFAQVIYKYLPLPLPLKYRTSEHTTQDN